jgi:DNA-directed RNA polymerase sigma subunit (sigma70/sigma32)
MTNEILHKKDLDIILEVNKKAIEIETSVVEQNEEIINLLNNNKSNQEEIISKQDNILGLIDKILSQLNDNDKEIYKLQILYVVGFLTFVAQIVQIFFKK